MCFCDYVCVSIFNQAVVFAVHNVRLHSFTNPLYCVCSVYIVFNDRAFGAPGEAGKVTIAHPAQHNTLAAAHVEYMNYEPLILPRSHGIAW